MNTLPDGFYAIRDPHDSEKVTCWRKRVYPTGGQTFGPWPPKTNYGPDWRSDSAAYQVYLDGVADKIWEDPNVANARFAKFASRCFLCGRVLRSDKWKCYGVGPECGRGFSSGELEYLADAMADAMGAAA